MRAQTRHVIGIRREDKSRFERRAPLTPDHVARLVRAGVSFVVQPSKRRAFTDSAYSAAGARVETDLSGCRVIFGVKEIPLGMVAHDTTYVNFSHVIKGQPPNMPTLARMLERRCTLVDYEKVRDHAGNRLIHFGRFAGLAGTIDALSTLGRRLRAEGTPNPFERIRPAHRYPGLDAAKEAVREVAARIRTHGFPDAIRPVVFGITGRGNVSGGAHEILDLLPERRVDASALGALDGRDPGVVHVVTFANRHLVESIEPGSTFDKREYRAHPERYRGIFERYVPHLTMLVNGIYWDARYPRLVTKRFVRRHWARRTKPRLRVIADITADIEGAIEVTLKSTDPDRPVFVYDAARGGAIDGVEGNGPVILAVDFLPTELPAESSAVFADALEPFVPALAGARYDVPYEALELPDPIRRAIVAHGGSLTPDFTYITRHLTELR